MNLLRRTPKPTLDRDTPHVLEVEPPQCGTEKLLAVIDGGRYIGHQPFRCLLPANHGGPHQWGKG